MQTGSKICRMLMWLSLIVFGGFQWIAIYGINKYNRIAVQNGASGDAYTIWPLMTAMIVLTLAVVWFTVVRRYRLPGVLVAGAAAIAIFAISLDLWQTFDASVVLSGGLTLWKLIWRHMSSLLVFVFMLAAYCLEQAAPRTEEDLPADSLL